MNLHTCTYSKAIHYTICVQLLGRQFYLKFETRREINREIVNVVLFKFKKI